jgi:hypothetical protein
MCQIGTIRYIVGLNHSGTAHVSVSEDAFKSLGKAKQGRILGYYVCDRCEGWFPSNGQLTKHQDSPCTK